MTLNSLPNNKILDRPKLTAFADENVNDAKMMISLYDREEKNFGKRRKCWLPAFSPFPTMFSEGFVKDGIVW